MNICVGEQGEVVTPSAEVSSCTEKLAARLYTAYCNAVGGVAFNGDPLPTWEEFKADENKAKQCAAWFVTAETAVAALSEKCCE